MVISIKDGLKFFSVSIIAFCAVFICSLFTNYAIDLAALDTTNFSYEQLALYKGQIATSKVVCGVSGGFMALMAVVTLIFYVKRYVDLHAKELGILKALGWSDFKIARSFAVFGLCVFVGCLLGFCVSWGVMPSMYSRQAGDMLPGLEMNFHVVIPLCYVLIPAVIFAFIACLNAYLTLRAPVMQIIRGKVRDIKFKEKSTAKVRPFKTELALSVLSSKKTLAFFIFFGGMCFAIIQMALDMVDIASEMMAIMMFVITVVLGCISLLLAITSCMRDNERTIFIMKAFGYTRAERFLSVTAIYAPFAIAGFFVGTVYQFGLLKIMVEVIFEEFDITYDFNVAAFFITFAAFAVFYSAVTFFSFLTTDKKRLKTEE